MTDVAVGWDTAADWSRFAHDHVNGIDNTLALSVAAGEGVISVASGVGASGNDRRILFLNGWSATAVEARLSFRIVGSGQCGLVVREDQRRAPISWNNIVFAATGNLLPGVWEYDGTTLASINQQAGTSSLWGSDIVSAVGNGTAVTVTTVLEHLLSPGSIVDHASTFGSFGQATVATTPTATTYTFASAVAGSWTGGRYRWVIAPPVMRNQAVRLVDRTLTHKQWVPPHPEPEWDDPVRAVVQLMPATLASGRLFPSGAGRVGIVVAHLGETGGLVVDDLQVTSLDDAVPATEGGSWQGLADMYRTAADEQQQLAVERPTSCPVCGWVPLDERDGVLNCPAGDWTSAAV